MTRKKIAYVNFHYFDTDITVVKELQKSFDVEWHVILRERDEAYDKQFFIKFVEGTGIHLHLYKYTCRRREIQFFLLLAKVIRRIRRERVSLIYTSCSDNLYLQIALLTIAKPIPIIHGIHDVEKHSSTKNPSLPVRLGTHLLYRYGKYFFTFSKNQQELFERNHKGKECYNVGMSIKLFGKSKMKIPSKKEETRFLMFGSMRLYKGYDLLIKAYERILETNHCNNTMLSMYGSANGSDFDYIMRNAIHKSYYNLHIEFVSNDIIKDIYSTNHFAVMPYRDATQSGPLMIAIGYGIPVIAPSFGVFRDILPSDASILYNPNDENGLYESLQKALKMSVEDYLQLRRHCSLLRKKFTEESIGKNYVEAIEEILMKVHRKK